MRQHGADFGGDVLDLEASGQLTRGLFHHRPAQSLLAAHDMTGRLVQVPHQSRRGERLEGVVADVDLVPAKALAGGALVMVVVVVPPLAEGEQRQPQVVARLVARHVAPAPRQVGQRVDRKGRVPQRDRGPEEPDHQARPAGQDPDQKTGENGRKIGVAVQPDQLWALGEIGHGVQIGAPVRLGEEPAEMSVPETVAHGRVHVVVGVREAVMLTVVSRPPQNAALGGALREKGQDEGEGPACPEAPVGEIAVIAGGDPEHPERVEPDRDHQIAQVDAGPERSQAAKMDGDEGGRLD